MAMKRGPGRPPNHMTGSPEIAKISRIGTMHDAMAAASVVVREQDTEQDPDPYGYLEEVEQSLGIELLPPKWRPRPDDLAWVKRRTARARKAAVAALNLQGKSLSDIAKQLRVSEVTVRRDIDNIAQEWRLAYISDIEDLAGRDLARLDYMLSKIWPEIEKGDVNAVAAGVKIIDQRGKILGYNQGVQVDIEQWVREVAASHGYDPDKAVQIATRISVQLNK